MQLGGKVATRYFNPRPRVEGGNLTTAPYLKGRGISIHALVQRADRELSHNGINLSISIHALVQRAAYPVSVSRAAFNFNPRPRAEGGTRFSHK